MSPQDFKTHIKKIRKEAIQIGFSISTMDGYLKMWNAFIKWKNKENFEYNEKDYSKFLLEYYKFDINTYTSKSKSHHQQLMRSKKILDDFDSYKQFMIKTTLPKSLFCDYPKEWNPVLENYINYLTNVRNNSESSIKIKKDYLLRLLSYFYQKGINNLNDITKKDIIIFINETVDKGNVSKRRNFYVLKEFLNYLFIEDILKEDLSILIPKIKNNKRMNCTPKFRQEKKEGTLQDEQFFYKRSFIKI